MSYWMESAPAAPHPPLTGDTEADVAVVGAGVAGLATAWELTRAGRRVVLLEADRIAGGSTGHTTAKVTALHNRVYDGLRRTRGPEGARLYASSQQAAVERVVAVTAELGIDCDLERRPAYTYTTRGEGVAELRAEAEAAREAGLDASFVTETGLPFPVTGAVRVEDQAQFHPRRYLIALAEDLTARGGRIHEGTRVTGLKEGDPCRLTTADGHAVTAGHVVVATHYPVFDRALLFTRLSVHRELVVAAPIPESADPGGMFITSEDGKRSVRTAPRPGGGRLLIVTGESFTPGSGHAPEGYRRLERWTLEHFPGTRISHRWAAQDADPTDTVPMVGPLHPGARNTHVATGFGGWGMTGGVMAARLLTARITGQELPPWAALYDPRRLRSALRELPPFWQHQAKVAQHFVGDRVTAPGAGTVADIAPGTGAVVRVGAGHRAVYRAQDGTVHALTARCTHLGCLVAFNEAETTWECPCHGSRFGIDGRVLQGPANTPLEPRDLD
ncbi:FAD-dependent oxidoreductase [Streptomyces sp. NPDC018031]|uniref:FAD-dependent oxidoreductase n=1 Tax=Streptomyces sp. NPDC018031 TaxID=3365033 RepID=UPI0037A2C47E